MKSIKLILVLWLGTSVWAQIQPLNQRVTAPAAAKPNAALISSSGMSPKSSATAATSKITHRSARNGLLANATAASSNTKHGRKVSQSSSVKTAGGESVSSVHKGRRDPFVSPIVDRVSVAGSCVGSGRKCLVIGEISLHGVVHSPGGFIAVVMNGEHTYFLRERDPLADGSVERITKDAIILREHSSDLLGRPVTRDVTKKLGVPSV